MSAPEPTKITSSRPRLVTSIRPIPLLPLSTNQTLPSGPAVMAPNFAFWKTLAPKKKVRPSGAIWANCGGCVAPPFADVPPDRVTYSFPSDPVAMSIGPRVPTPNLTSAMGSDCARATAGISHDTAIPIAAIAVYKLRTRPECIIAPNIFTPAFRGLPVKPRQRTTFSRRPPRRPKSCPRIRSERYRPDRQITVKICPVRRPPAIRLGPPDRFPLVLVRQPRVDNARDRARPAARLPYHEPAD